MINMQSRNILYVGRVGIPNTAAGIRIYNNAKSLRDLGYRVDFICDLEDNETRQTVRQYDGFCYSFKEWTNTNKYIHSISHIFELIFARKVFARVKSYCEATKPVAIILYNDLYSLTKKLIPFCESHSIKLIADVTEWYEPKKTKKISEKIIPYFTDKRIRELDNKVHNIIAISPYLYKYYSNLGCNTIMLPPVFDIANNLRFKKYNYYKSHVLNLVYAGSPGSKDILLPVLEAIQDVNKETLKIRFDLVGIDDGYIKQIWKDVNFKAMGIITHGLLPHNKTMEIVERADFGVLLRYNKRYAKAGFSTKFVECMSCGVPMICNRVGSADSLIETMENGVVIDDYNKNIIFNTLIDLYNLEVEEILRLKKNAYLKALSLFDRKSYINILEKYLSNGRMIAE